MPQRDSRRIRSAIVTVVLVAAVAFVYRGAAGFDFVNLDDPDYVSRNAVVQGGLGWSALWWALTSFHAANWHPLTWLSHLADASLFGPNAGAAHLVNLGLHAACTAALFQVLRALTGSFWPSAVVAALFAVHPVQVETVAWVAERKTVLSSLAGILAVRAYLVHVARPGSRSLAGVAALFTVSLLAKPVLVVLPLLLLLLDWWPLGRFGSRGFAPGEARSAIGEKAPLFALALLSGVVTIAAQSHSGAVASLRHFSLPARLGNALLSCTAYLGDLFLPRDLTVFYAHPGAAMPWGRVGLAALALAGITFAALRARRAAPYLALGWLWYLVSLLPMLGIIQVGGQARADRYLYLALVGIFVAVAWGAADLVRRRPRSRAAVAVSIAAAVALLALAAHRQAGYWRDSGTLWERALAVDPRSQTALYQLSEHYRESGRVQEQAALLRRLLSLDPRHELALNNFCIARHALGEKPEALFADYRSLLAINPNNVKALQNYGYLLIEAGRPAAAIAPLERAIGLDPAYCTAINNLGRAHLALGDKAAARASFERAVSCDPRQRKYRANLDLAR